MSWRLISSRFVRFATCSKFASSCLVLGMWHLCMCVCGVWCVGCGLWAVGCGLCTTDAQAGRSAATSVSTAVKKQVIEQGSVKYVLRLLFVSQPIVKGLMNKMLLHITAHPRSVPRLARLRSFLLHARPVARLLFMRPTLIAGSCGRE